MLPVQPPLQPTPDAHDQPERDHSRRLCKRASPSLRDSVTQSDKSLHSTPADSPELLQSPPTSLPSRFQNSAASKLTKPHLRQSASFASTSRHNMDTVTPPRSDVSTNSPRQRYSDETGGALKPVRKKSGFSSFVNSLVGSPRRPNISAPENPVHVTHVGYNFDTGEFTVSHPLPSFYPTTTSIPYPAPHRKRLLTMSRAYQRNGNEYLQRRA